MSMTNRIFKTAAILGIVFGLSQFAIHAQNIAANQTQNSQKQSEIIVHGDGEVSAAPDRAVVRLGVEAQAEEAAAAQAAVNSAMQRVLTSITKLDVPKRSIKTATIVLSPLYSSRSSANNEPPHISAYRASNTIQVELSDLKQVGPVIDASMASGANRLDGVSFDLKDDLRQRTDALRQAVTEARTKARAIADTLDVKLGSVAEVNEGGISIIRPQEQFAVRAMAMAAPSTPVEPGEIRVRANVTMRYRIAE